jgi:hypothetical protein
LTAPLGAGVEIHMQSKRYQVLERIGGNGRASVYRATQGGLGREVCIRWYPRSADGDSGDARLRGVLRSLSGSSHDHVVRLWGIEDSEQGLAVAFAWVEGELLSECRLPLSEEQVLRIGRALCEAVVHLHRHARLHPVLLPDRIKLAANGLPVVLDPGLDSGALTAEDRQDFGGFLAPELAAGRAASSASDVYSVGALMAWLSGGSDRMRQGLRAVVSRCLRAEPSLRYGDAGELLQALRSRSRSRSKRSVTALTAAALVGVAGSWVALSGGDEASAATAYSNLGPKAAMLVSGWDNDEASTAGRRVPVEAPAREAPAREAPEGPAPTVVPRRPIAGGATPSPDWAIRLDGMSGHAISSTVPTLTSESTWEAWIKVDSSIRWDDGGPLFFQCGHHGQGIVRFDSGRSKISAFGGLGPSSESSILADEWQHVAVVIGPEDSPSHRMFLDGRLVGEGPIGRFDPCQLRQRSLVLGAIDCCCRSFVVLDDFLRVSIDEVRISRGRRYSTDFSPERRFEVEYGTVALWHFDEGNGTVVRDSSGNGHHLALVGGCNWIVRHARGRRAASTKLDTDVRCGVDPPSLHTAVANWPLVGGRLAVLATPAAMHHAIGFAADWPSAGVVLSSLVDVPGIGCAGGVLPVRQLLQLRGQRTVAGGIGIRFKLPVQPALLALPFCLQAWSVDAGAAEAGLSTSARLVFEPGAF